MRDAEQAVSKGGGASRSADGAKFVAGGRARGPRPAPKTDISSLKGLKEQSLKKTSKMKGDPNMLLKTKTRKMTKNV